VVELMTFDENGIVRQLEQVAKPVRGAFAAAAAERLMPMYLRFHERTTQGDPARLENALEAAWRGVSGQSRDDELGSWQAVAEALVPDEDDSWTDDSAFAQHAAAAVAYALRSLRSTDPREAGWAARQVYEAADYAELARKGAVDINEPGAERRILTSDLVQFALAGIHEDLAAALAAGGRANDIPASMRVRAREGGQRLRQLVSAHEV